MLRQIRVDGYRSLTDFKLEIKPGLNILVGPNGSGKTNIVSFFEFLSYMIEGALSDAVFKSGGVSAVFQRVPSDCIIPPIKIEIQGQTRRKSPFRSERNSDRGLYYEYSCKIKISEEESYIYYAGQTLKIAYLNAAG
ncbi:AAA family ATPase [Bauldia sp.]|uniref:AAA family ATPase n=1 Tax=Bauldia sp. TaxID=2575872 RepID=UPI003BA93ABE